MMRARLYATLLLGALLFVACSKGPAPGEVQDEAKRAGRTPASFPHADEDYLKDMDGGIALSAEEVRGRNMWIVWSGGNDRFWNGLTEYTFGAFDLLKIISSHPSLGYSRDNRWAYLGLVNEPCFDAAKGPSKDRRGLWLDVRSKDCAPDPFENEQKYPGVVVGSRGKPLGNGTSQPVGSFYGYATGIVGLRLFPNPDFDEKAAKHWDAERYYTDPNYHNDRRLVRPYRVGMSCGFRHVGPSPLKPPSDPEHRTFANLSSSVGAQYMWVDRMFIFNSNKPEGRRNFMFQLAHTYRPGSMDTSIISADSINNPRTMNAVYDFVSRMGLAQKLGHERIAGGELDNKQLPGFSIPPRDVRTPHVLRDGADSVGLLGALNRVYINIGLFSEEWQLHFNTIVGGQAITPIPIKTAQKNSVYWLATEAGTLDTARFFLKAAQPDRLKDAPGGGKYLIDDAATLARGKQIFADTCARCHSSKAPAPPTGLDIEKCQPKLAGVPHARACQTYRVLQPSSAVAPARQARRRLDRARLGRVAVDRSGAAACGLRRRIAAENGGRLHSCLCGRPFESTRKRLALAALGGRPECEDLAAPQLPGALLHAAVDKRPCEVRHSRASARRAREASGHPAHRTSCARHARAVRRGRPRGGRRIPEGRTALSRASRAEWRAYAIAQRARAARGDRRGRRLQYAAAAHAVRHRPAAQLRLHGIAMRAELPGVGSNLQDRYEVALTHRMRAPWPVLDGAFRVHGVRGLRVVDASVFPRIPGFFVTSAVHIVGEKAADAILDEARREMDVTELLKKSQTELDELFKAAPAGDILSGEAKGTAIIAPGTEWSPNIASFINLFGWQGKVFDAEKGLLKNRITAFGIAAIVERVYKGPSWLDSKECIVLDYSDTSLVAHWIRDEIRLIDTNLYLGKVYWGKDRLIDFALEFNKG